MINNFLFTSKIKDQNLTTNRSRVCFETTPTFIVLQVQVITIHGIFGVFSILNEILSITMGKFIMPLFVKWICIFSIFLSISCICFFIHQFWFGISNFHFYFIERISIDRFLINFELHAIFMNTMGNPLFYLFWILKILSVEVKNFFICGKLNSFLINWTFEILLDNRNNPKSLVNNTLYILCYIAIVNVFLQI